MSDDPWNRTPWPSGAKPRATTYEVAIGLADAAEERVRKAEILAPYCFMESWLQATREIRRIQERAK